MIEVLSSLVPTMEHAMQSSVVFAALSHGLDVLMKRYRTWVTDRKWAKLDADWAATAKEVSPVPMVESVLDDIKDAVTETVKKSKKNV